MHPARLCPPPSLSPAFALLCSLYLSLSLGFSVVSLRLRWSKNSSTTCQVPLQACVLENQTKRKKAFWNSAECPFLPALWRLCPALGENLEPNALVCWHACVCAPGFRIRCAFLTVRWPVVALINPAFRQQICVAWYRGTGGPFLLIMQCGSVPVTAPRLSSPFQSGPDRDSGSRRNSFSPVFSSLITKKESKYERVRKIGLTLRDLQQCFSAHGSQMAGKNY